MPDPTWRDPMADPMPKPTTAQFHAALDLRLTYGRDAGEILARRMMVARQFGEAAQLEQLAGIYRALIGISAVPPPSRAG